MLFKYKPSSKDYMEYSRGNLLTRMVTAEDGRFRIGFAIYLPGVIYERALWFDEVFYVIKGKLKFIYRSYLPPEKGAKKTLRVNAGEAVFMSKGTWMRWCSEEEAEVFYVAMPSSSQGVNYILRQKVEPAESHLRELTFKR